MKKVNWLKITGVAILIMIILIALVFLTVVVYSMVIDTGHPEAYYEEFATKAAPYVATIGGFILMYWFVIRLNKGKDIDPFIIGLGLPITYLVLDVIVIILTVPDWMEGLELIAVSDAIKLSGGVLAAWRIKRLRP